MIQASTPHVFFIEGSVDGERWTVLWRIEPLRGLSGLRTRRVILDRPAHARFIGIRSTSLSTSEVSEVLVFGAPPETWPPLDRSSPQSSLPLFPELTADRVRVLLGMLSAMLVFVVGWSVIARRCPSSPLMERLRKSLLVGVAFLSLAAWPNALNFHYFGALHTWEFAHYYLGGKYLAELGYTRLYECTAVTDILDGLPQSDGLMRDLQDDRLVSATVAANRIEPCRARFSRQRWQEFQADARFFRSMMGQEWWAGVRQDHGFNAPPTWALAGGSLARLSPASLTQLTLLSLLDAVLLAAMLGVIGRVFGLESACLAAGFWSLNALSVFGWTGGGMLRYDWIFLLVLGIACLKTNRPVLAGIALAYSALLRVFPVFAIAAIGLRACIAATEQRSLLPLRRQARFAIGLAAGTALLIGSSTLVFGADTWVGFFRNLVKHSANQSANVVGLRAFLASSDAERIEILRDPLLDDPDAAWVARRSSAERKTALSWWAAAISFVLLLSAAVRRAPDWLAAVLGAGSIPILLNVASYYHCVLIVFALAWPVSGATGLALACFAWASNGIHAFWPEIDMAHARLSLASVVLTAVVTGVWAWRARAPEPSTGRPPVDKDEDCESL